MLALAAPDERRLGVLSASLSSLELQPSDACLVLLYRDLAGATSAAASAARPLLARCSVCVLCASYVESLQRAAPPDVSARYSRGVFLLLDDVALSGFALRAFVRRARALRLDGASPAVRGTWRFMAPHRHGGDGRRVRVLEVQALWCAPRFWRCLWELFDPALNGGGYGLDVRRSSAPRQRPR